MTETDVRASGVGNRRRRLCFCTVAVTAAGMDLASKAAASAALARRSIDLPGPLDLRLAYNSGVAFGLGNRTPTWLLLAVTASIAALVAHAGWRGEFHSSLGAALVLGGALGNIIDRLQGGSVVDMLDIGWWPTFNLADVFITTGVALLLLQEIRADVEARRHR